MVASCLNYVPQFQGKGGGGGYSLEEHNNITSYSRVTNTILKYKANVYSPVK